MLKIGINYCSNVEYHSDNNFLSSSNLKLLLKDREKFYREKILQEPGDKLKGDHLDEGSLTHSLILEPHMVNEEYAFYPGLRKSGEEFRQFKLANQNKLIISRPQQIRADAYYSAYKQNQIAPTLIVDGLAEHTVCTEINNVPLKIRCDWININQRYIVDVKTTAFPADLDTFKMTINKWSYDLSAALYTKVCEAYYGHKFDFYFIVIDKKNIICEVYKASEDTLFKGELQVNEAMKIYKKCKETGIWKNEVSPIEHKMIQTNQEILEV